MAKTSVVEELAEGLDLDEDLQETEDTEGSNDHEDSQDVYNFEGSEGWNEYVLSKLRKDEKAKNGAPKALGLLRFARTYFEGDIDWTQEVHHVSPEYAAVTIRLMYLNREICASAEAGVHNCDEPFCKYPLATAQTRALGRALKMALNLNLLTAEETSRVADLTIPQIDEDRTEGSIRLTQITFIDRMCKKLNVGVKETVQACVGNHENINEVSHAEALEIQETLDRWSKGDEGILDVAYDSSWKSNFYIEKEGK